MERHKPIITQCMNCFDVGHNKAGCFRPMQCKKCTQKGEHVCKAKPRDDPKERYKEYQCCYCKEFGHPPTWSGCSWIKTRIERSRGQKEEKIN